VGQSIGVARRLGSIVFRKWCESSSQGCGFVGCNPAVALAGRQQAWEIVAVDNLMRRGSDPNHAQLRVVGVEFVHGDVREARRPEGGRAVRRDGRAIGTRRLRRSLLLGPDQFDRRLQLGPPARLPPANSRSSGSPRRFAAHAS
jgi:hypothetical protein